MSEISELKSSITTLLLEVTRADEKAKTFVNKEELGEFRAKLMKEIYAAIKETDDKVDGLNLKIAKWSGGIAVIVFLAGEFLS